MNRNRISIALVAACTALLGSTSSSHASDGKSFPGAICHAEQGSTSAFRITDMSYWSTDQTHWVSCPFVRDTIISTGGMTDLAVYAGQAQFVKGSVCDARSMGAAGGGVARYVRKDVPMFNSGKNKIEYGKGLNSGYDRGLYTLECKVTARYKATDLFGAYISQIDMVEKD